VRANRTLFKRFHARRVEGTPEACWEWTGSVTRTGYGELSNCPGPNVRANRIAWRLFSGRWPSPGRCVCHRCNNKNCVNPNHLYLASGGKNMTDAWRDGLCGDRKGQGHPLSKLTEEQARWIFRQKGKTTSRRLAEQFGVVAATVKKIWSKKNWRHLD
jgi:hypothetical protein